MAASEPFIQGKTRELKQIVPLLKGCFAQVYLMVSAYEADPLGLTFSEVQDLTGLSRPSVSAALSFLSRNNLIESRMEEGAPRYRTCFGFYYRGGQTNTRTNSDAEIIFTSDVHDVEKNDTPPLDEMSKHSFNHEAATILERAGLEGKNLERLALKVSPTTAQQWAEWIEYADPNRWTNPAGYCYNRLKVNPTEKPPYVKKPQVAEARDYKKNPVVTGRLAEKYLAPQEQP